MIHMGANAQAVRRSWTNRFGISSSQPAGSIYRFCSLGQLIRLLVHFRLPFASAVAMCGATAREGGERKYADDRL